MGECCNYWSYFYILERVIKSLLMRPGRSDANNTSINSTIIKIQIDELLRCP